ncbi:bifunctional phosphatase PAP2/diacylglycerol kinase family protein [Allokutzneria albata]|uniref:Undecaprenyl-diphosphatase n=1 Tax=Allokutzneria albata TaxID=211114 RepID=A0A1G9RBI9_ALLAB|nr:bifunctional phosphatase PAP2/diacylglycerol kinase family protein [Allokutzneria albata]SDM20594.1 undecaprenyl-diphosphatase [Allokutzneria albata]
MIEKLHAATEAVIELDQALVRRSARLPRSKADRALKTLSRAANHGVLWFAIAGLLAARKGPTRRAAARGVAAIAGTSPTVNLVMKLLLPRRRPAAELMPARRRLSSPPTSSSFPSGHAASAAAFTTAVAMESPLTGAVIAPLAAAVAYSRVHTGVHWGSDVVAGAAVGTGIALATRRWWPVHPDEPAEVRPDVEAAALDEGQGMLVLVNPNSGIDGEDPSEQIRSVWPNARIVHPKKGMDLIEQIDKEISDSTYETKALGVAGGDGSVAAMASVAARKKLPLAVIPAGTLNHFARDIGVERLLDVDDAVREGHAVGVDLATVRVDNQPKRWFINTASLGGYPDMVMLREKWQGRWGKWPAAAVALVRVLHQAQPLEVRVNGKRHKVWLLFVGNGPYRPRGFAPTRRPRLDDGLLDIRYVRADIKWSRIRFVVSALTGTLHRSRTYVQQERPNLVVEVLGPAVAIATDGEVGPEGNRFRFAAHEAALHAYREEHGRNNLT